MHRTRNREEARACRYDTGTMSLGISKGGLATAAAQIKRNRCVTDKLIGDSCLDRIKPNKGNNAVNANLVKTLNIPTPERF